MRWIWPLVMMILLLVAGPTAYAQEARLKEGDKISVVVFEHEAFSGQFKVMSDGSISGNGWGRVVVRQKTIGQVERELTRILAKRVREPHVTVSLLDQQPDFVFVVNLSGLVTVANQSGPTQLLPNATLRSIFGGTGNAVNSDQARVTLMRGAKTVISCPLLDIFDTKKSNGNVLLDPADVIIISPTPQIRVWVTGHVSRPGTILLPEGADVQQAIAMAGGTTADTQQLEIFLHRGGRATPLPLVRGESETATTLESGDTIAVELPEKVRIIVDGAVHDPREIMVLPKDLRLEKVIALAGGILPAATMKNILVSRPTGTYRVDLTPFTQGGTPVDFELQPGDYVYVRTNERKFTVLGQVKAAGEFVMPDAKPVTLADALARAGGLSDKGSLLRVALARPNAKGKYEISMYGLDKFLKSGDATQNPVIQPDDVVFFTTTRGFNLQDMTSVLSSLLLVRTITR